mgnify:CR=1 FL=1
MMNIFVIVNLRCLEESKSDGKLFGTVTIPFPAREIFITKVKLLFLLLLILAVFTTFNQFYYYLYQLTDFLTLRGPYLFWERINLP